MSMLFGLIPLPWWGYVLVALGLTHATIVAVTLYLHRHQAHRAVDLHPVVAHVFRAWLWLTTAMVTREWVAVHRKHHARVETPEDPHSPQIIGLGRLLRNGTAYYQRAAADPDTLATFGHGTPDDWLERRLYARWPCLGPTVLAVVYLALFGVMGITLWAVQMLWVPFWAAGVINGLGHAVGYRNFEPRDASTNIVPLGVLIGGEELHNNHHAFPQSARFSSRPWELDLGWLYLRGLQRLGLARVKRLPPTPRLAAKAEVDLETVRAVVRGRVQVMAFYAREVLIPIVRQEVALADGRCRRLLRRGRRLVVRDPGLIDERQRGRLDRALAQSGRLATVYQYKLRLQQLWTRSQQSHEAFLLGLREWCAEAETTGIRALEDFARRLRGFSLGGSAA